MTQTHEISVVMSVYNAEKYVFEAIESILNQSYRDFEFLITDDASTDSSLQILKDFENEDKRIKLYKNKENLGLTKNLNLMLQSSKGRFIARMDADDISLPDRFEKQLDFMNGNPDIGVCGTNILFFGSSDHITSLPETDDEIKASLLFRDVIMHPTVFIRRSVLETLIINYDENFRISQDYDLWCRLSGRTKLANLPERLLRYRFQEGNITTSTKSKYRETFLEKIFSYELGKIGIIPDEKELETHIKISAGKKLAQFRELEEIGYWLKKILKANRSKPFYDSSFLERTASEYWFMLCTNSTGFGMQTFLCHKSFEFYDSFDPGLSYRIKFFIKCLFRFGKN